MEDDGYEKILLDQMEMTSKYWFDQAQMTLRDRLYKQQNTNVAKNIIYFLGDGMSLTTLTAARIFQGQLNGKNGEESDLWFQKFPNVGLAKVSLRATCEIFNIFEQSSWEYLTFWTMWNLEFFKTSNLP